MSVTSHARPVPSADQAPHSAPDLLAIALVRRLLLSRYMPLALQVLGLFALGGVLLDGFLGTPVRGENFATLGVWSLFFWPVVLSSLLLLGRAWCAVCPLGTLTAAAGHLSRRWPFPRRLSHLGHSLAAFVLVLWVLRPLLGISESPARTAWFLALWSVAAVAIGLLFPVRAFCRYLCPIAAPLSALARVAPVALRAGQDGRLGATCRGCRGHECYAGSATVGGCPMGEFPATMDENARCIFCLKCLKSCSAPGREQALPLQIRLRWPFAELAAVRRPSLAESLTIVALLGVFLGHMAYGHEPRIPPFLRAASQAVGSAVPSFRPADVTYLVTLAAAFLGVAGIYALAVGLSGRLAGLSFRRALTTGGYPFLALVAFRATGYMVGDLVTRGGDLLNYGASLLGVHVYCPPALLESALRPLIPGTSYHLWGVFLTVPLLLGLPVAWLLAYRLWRRALPTAGRALVVAAPSLGAMLLLVAVYEWAYLVGFKVIQ